MLEKQEIYDKDIEIQNLKKKIGLREKELDVQISF